MRVSGPAARAIAERLLGGATALTPRRATVGAFRSAGAGRAAPIDQVVATWFPAPHSYTTQDVVEIGAHGSPVVLDALIASAIDAGARLARPGEFTLRAYLGGRLDLTQAEAVADLIAAVTPLQARAASEQLEGRLARDIRAAHAQLFDLVARLEASLDFPEEGYHFVDPAAAADAIETLRRGLAALAASGRRGRLVREGVTIALVGRPNTGKSSLFNRLVGAERAIVSHTPGTTRDVVTDVVDLDGLRATLVDTAGWRRTGDVVEAEGVRRAEAAAQAATAAVVVLDSSEPLGDDDRLVLDAARGARVVVAHKSDLPARWSGDQVGSAVRVSSRTGEGLDGLVRAIHEALGATAAREEVPRVTNLRHVALIEQAQAALGRAAEAAAGGMPEEIVLVDLHEARRALEDVVGLHATDDLLEHIFARFCIGK